MANTTARDRDVRWAVLAIACAILPATFSRAAEPATLPNFVIILADDAGYGDLGCYGHPTIRTPNLDRMAAEGTRFTDFYVAQAVCSASRAALLTGCYPNRIGILGALNHQARIGIGDKEMTIAQVLQSRGYATAIYGKWHLGHHPRFLPTRHGFDDYFGLPYSNDMGPTPAAPDNPPVPLFSGEAVVETAPDMNRITARYTEKAVDFIRKNRDRPFFLYLPHTMPHVPLGASDRVRGQSKAGLYGDVIEEIDWSVGQILSAIKELRLDGKTLVLFTSDNGPWLSYGNHGGSAGPLREGKGTTWDGGVREPCILRWPGHVPAGRVCREPWMNIDILPTFARLAGAPLPKPPIDGKDARHLWLGEPDARSPNEAYFFYWNRRLEAVRSGRWKLHFPHEYRTLKGDPGRDGRAGTYVNVKTGLALFDLESDIGEKEDVADSHPDIVRRLTDLAETARTELGDSLARREGRGVRPPGTLPGAADRAGSAASLDR